MSIWRSSLTEPRLLQAAQAKRAMVIGSDRLPTHAYPTFGGSFNPGVGTK